MEKIYLSLGSNIPHAAGDCSGNIARATGLLETHGIRVTRRSSLYKTEPVEFLDQDWFLNCVLEAETNLSPEELMDALLEIEQSLGRQRRLPKGPRLIDMDIVLYGSRVIREADLEIPHPRMAERRFVLVPFAEIAPDV